MSSQWGPKAAPVQHSAHILLGFILREHQSTSASFLGDVGEGSGPALVSGGARARARFAISDAATPTLDRLALLRVLAPRPPKVSLCPRQ